ncbi:MAG: FxsB family cyclophane-forming radical SAM/SPASM peptide maturase [bacterium]
MKQRIVKTFFLRVSARCILNCDYCYVFNHADQGWKKLPERISDHNIYLFANRLLEYFNQTKVDKVLVVLHGGEPLMLGTEALSSLFSTIRDTVGHAGKVEFSIQTNGFLLNEKMLTLLNEHACTISVSIDGPKHIHDRHRLNKNGESTFFATFDNINFTRERFPKLYSGIISVIDPFCNPEELFEFYRSINPPSIDTLLPDANHIDPPNNKDSHPEIYINWLIKAFDAWFDKYNELKHRTFDVILNRLIDLRAGSTDCFGSGELEYLTIETDGSYHTTDILKVAYEGASAIGMNLENASIKEAFSSEIVSKYNELLKEENLPKQCLACEVKNVCAAGSIPHRFGKNGFDNPSVYCSELKALIKHCKFKLETEMKNILSSNNKSLNE